MLRGHVRGHLPQALKPGKKRLLLRDREGPCQAPRKRASSQQGCFLDSGTGTGWTKLE